MPEHIWIRLEREEAVSLWDKLAGEYTSADTDPCATASLKLRAALDQPADLLSAPPALSQEDGEALEQAKILAACAEDYLRAEDFPAVGSDKEQRLEDAVLNFRDALRPRPLASRASSGGEGRADFTDEERSILDTLLRREWASHTTTSPEVRVHLDKIERLMKKVAALSQQPEEERDA